MDLDLNMIHQGDCLEGLKRLSPGVVDLAFADPPFNIDYQYDVYDDNRDYHAYLEWTRTWMGEVCRVLKPHGTFWVAIGDEYAAEIKLIAQDHLGLVCRSWVIWYYTFGVHCTKKFTRSHTHLFYFVKDPRQFTFNDQEIRVPSARQLIYADSRANPDGRVPDDTWILRPQVLGDGFPAEHDTWYFARVAGTFKERAGFHGCQMPEQLLGRIVRCCSPAKNGLVLDPFAGSGTTLAVAKKLGREWIGFELSEDYVRQASSRIAAVYEGQALEGSSEPLASAPRAVVRDPITPVPDSKSESTRVSRAARRPASGPESPGEDGERVEGLLDAFLTASEGYSTDRVIADPELNNRFLEQCWKSGVSGQPINLNRALMRLRKTGRLADLPASRQTSFPGEELDRYLFASEIGMRRVMDEAAASLDDVLCDPDLAASFDEIARLFAPGFSSLHYRWGALRLRKRAHDARESSRALPPDLLRRRFRPFRPVDESAAEGLDGTPGIYLVRGGEEQRLYAGETLDLARRIRYHRGTPDEWLKISDAIEVGVIPLAGIEASSRLGLHSHYIGKYTPNLNLLGLGVA